MRIAAISDFHVGATEQTDCFRHSSQGFLRFLDELESTHDTIVLLGDIFQSEYGPLPGKRTERRQLLAARDRIPEIWERFASDRYEYIFGNHDAVASNALKARRDLRITADGFSVYFTHGDQFDPLLQNIYPLARASTWLSGRIRRAGMGTFADWLEEQDVSIKHRKFQGNGGPYALGARRLLRTQRVDAVIMGHTHVQQRLELGGGVYANTGTCSHGNKMYVSVDTEHRTVRCLQSA